MNDLTKAAQCGESAVSLLAEFTADTDTEVKGTALRLLGDVALAMNNADEADRQYRQAEQIFEATDNHLEHGRLLMRRARLAALKSDRELSKSYLKNAERTFNQLGARLDIQKLDILERELNFPHNS